MIAIILSILSLMVLGLGLFIFSNAAKALGNLFGSKVKLKKYSGFRRLR